MEASNAPLADPVFVLGLLLPGDSLLGLLGNLGVLGGLSGLVFDAGLVLLVLVGGLELLLLLTGFDSGRALTLFADVLVLAGDGQGVVVGPFDVDVLLVDAGELAVQLVGFLGLLDVELRGEGADALELAVDVVEGLAVVLVEEAEDGSELLSEAWEERHGCWCGCEGACRSRLGNAVELLWDSADCCAQ